MLEGGFAFASVGVVTSRAEVCCDACTFSKSSDMLLAFRSSDARAVGGIDVRFDFLIRSGDGFASENTTDVPFEDGVVTDSLKTTAATTWPRNISRLIYGMYSQWLENIACI